MKSYLGYSIGKNDVVNDHKVRLDITPKGFERKVRRERKADGMIVERSDSKDYMPDFICITHEDDEVMKTDGRALVFFIECKRYLSVTTIKAALRKWKRGQAKQYAMARRLNKAGISVMLHLVLKGGRHVVLSPEERRRNL